MKTLFTVWIWLASALAAVAGPANIAMVKLVDSGSEVTLQVAVAHDDDGWQHFTNSIALFSTDGEMLAEQPIAEPHAGQKYVSATFTGVKIPDGHQIVVIRARCSIDGWIGIPVTISLY